MKNKNDTSSISFTAHYTGYTWYHYGLSAPEFVTSQGQLYFAIMRPLEWFARQIIGSDVRTTLLQRHALIDRELDTLIAQEPNLQILEIACGLSPRGHRFCQKHPHIRYIEADLPDMVSRKKRLLQSLHSLSDRHAVIPCNILEKGSDDSLENIISREFSTQKPLIIITEGLVNYFSLNTISQVWSNIAQLLKSFPQGTYLTDLYPEVDQHRAAPLIRFANRSLRIVSRSQFSLHLSSDSAIKQHFESLGFTQATVFNPDNEVIRAPAAKGGSIVRVIRAKA